MAVQTRDLTAESIRKNLKNNQHLLAVSKLQPIEKIIQLYQHGQIDFGENYVQEALEKIEQLVSLPIQWHLIGPVQKNKVKYLKNKFEYIHSVDSFELAQLISKKSEEINYVQKVFLQLNAAAENTKSGFSALEIEQHWSDLNQLSGIKIIGLMTMPPLQNNPDQNRIYFKNCFQLGKKLHLNEFSMGTSQDYEIAISEGATWIRLGTVLFGERLSK